MAVNKLIDHGFLAMTLEHQEHLEAFSFQLRNKTQVEIWDTGVIAFIPETVTDNGKDIVLSSGVHGNETAPVEILDEIVTSLLNETLATKSRMLFIFANPCALNVNKRYVLENMNRLFSGAYYKGNKKNSERKRAALLEMYITRFFGLGGALGLRQRAHYDLHTTIRGSKHEKFAVYPCQHSGKWDKSQFEFAAACGATAVLLYHKPASTFSYFSSNLFAASALTIELGKARPFGQNTKTDFIMAKKALGYLVTEGESGSHRPVAMPDIYKVRQNIIRTNETFYFTFARDIKNFTAFPENTVLGYDGGQPFKTDVDNEVIIFPLANVAIGHNAVLTAVTCQLAPEELC